MGEMSGQHSITLDHKLSPKPHSHDDGSGKPHSHDGQRGSCGSTSRGIQMNLSPMSTIQVDNVSKHLRTEVINLVADGIKKLTLRYSDKVLAEADLSAPP